MSNNPPQMFGGQQYLMFYKQNANNRQKAALRSMSGLRIDNQQKLLRLWEDEGVSDEYQKLVLRYFDSILNAEQLNKQIQIQLKCTYEHDTFFFRIEKYNKERRKAFQGLVQELRKLQRYKQQNQNGEPFLQRTCVFISHIRKLHLLIGQAVYQMFTTYGTPKISEPGYQYIKLIKKLSEDLKFLRQSILKYYMPFSRGFDAVFNELMEKLKKGYQHQGLVYNQQVHGLINLKASYLYRLLRTHQRMLELVSMESEAIEELPSYQQKSSGSRSRSRNILDDIAVGALKRQRKSTNQQYDDDQYPSTQKKYIIHSPQTFKLSPQSYKESPQSYKQSPQSYKQSAQTYKQPQKMKRNESRHNPNREYQHKLYQLNNQYKMPLQQSYLKPIQIKYQDDYILPQKNKLKIVKALNHNINQSSQQSRKPYIPKMLRVQTQPWNSEGHSRHQTIQRRSHTEQGTKMKNKIAEVNKEKMLPKLCETRLKKQHIECLCRKKYKQKHQCDNQDDITEEQAQKRRKLIINQVNKRYLALAQKQIRHKLSQIGDKTYHKVKNIHRSRESYKRQQRQN